LGDIGQSWGKASVDVTETWERFGKYASMRTNENIKYVGKFYYKSPRTWKRNAVSIYHIS